jgi:ATP-dependent Clp protease ATP-binding subunit ClpA
VMDHGTLTDHNGRKVDFRHIILVMTTNVGAEVMSRNSMGFMEQDNSKDGLELIRKRFSPEFRNRLDSIIQFAELTPEAINLIVEKFLVELQSKLREKHVTLEVDNNVRAWLAHHGYDKNMGARPMARLIREKLKKPLANELLFGKLAQGGGKVCVSVAGDEIVLDIQTSSAGDTSLKSPKQPSKAKDKEQTPLEE